MEKGKFSRRDLAALLAASTLPARSQTATGPDIPAQVRESLRRALESVRKQPLPAGAEPATVFRP